MLAPSNRLRTVRRARRCDAPYPRSPTVPPRLFTPKSLALADLLLDLTGYLTPGRLELTVSDQDLADALWLKKDSAYRALVELRSVGALTFTRPVSWRGYRGRLVWVNPASWVWLAVAATQHDGMRQR